jgi:hypothetical protein
MTSLRQQLAAKTQQGEALEATNRRMLEELDALRKFESGVLWGDKVDLTALASQVEALEKALRNMPKMKNGTPICLGDRVWVIYEQDEEPLLQVVDFTVESITSGKAFREYQGDFTICADNWEGGNLDCYATAEEANAALTPPPAPSWGGEL